MGRLLPLLTNLIPPPLQGKEKSHKLEYYVQLGFLITDYFSMFTQVSLYACFFVVSPPLVWSQSPGRDRLVNASPLLAPPSTHSTLPQDLAVTPDTLLQTEQKKKMEFHWKKMMSKQQLDKYIHRKKIPVYENKRFSSGKPIPHLWLKITYMYLLEPASHAHMCWLWQVVRADCGGKLE